MRVFQILFHGSFDPETLSRSGWASDPPAGFYTMRNVLADDADEALSKGRHYVREELQQKSPSLAAALTCLEHEDLREFDEAGFCVRFGFTFYSR